MRIKQEKLIEFEKKKLDTMLASILSLSLVSRVQSGEQNISFSVQSVSVCFIDIVEFTPWCGSNTAQYVMKNSILSIKSLMHSFLHIIHVKELNVLEIAT
jgi:hypothetical protein